MITAIFLGALISMALGFLTYAIVDIWLMDAGFRIETYAKIKRIAIPAGFIIGFIIGFTFTYTINIVEEESWIEGFKAQQITIEQGLNSDNVPDLAKTELIKEASNLNKNLAKKQSKANSIFYPEIPDEINNLKPIIFE